MLVFRKVFLIFALLLTIIGNSTTFGFCFCDNQFFLTSAHKCLAETHFADLDFCACGHHGIQEKSTGTANSDGDDGVPCKTLLVQLDDELAGTVAENIPQPLCYDIFFEAIFPAFCILLREHSAKADLAIENFKPPRRVPVAIVLPLLS